MKRTFSLLMVLCLLCSVLAVNVFAADSVHFGTSVSKSSVETGETITVTVSTSEITDGRTIYAKLNYDNSLLEYVSHSANHGGDSNNTGSAVLVVVEKSNPTTMSGTLMTVTFKAKAAGTASFSLSGCEATYGLNEIKTYPSSASGASVTITAPHVCAPVAVPAQAATCEADGYEAHYKCECGKLYADAAGTTPISAATPIPAKGHAWDNGKITTEPTCENEGVKTFTCQNDASHTKTEAVAALGHAWDAGKVTTPATCTEDGVMTYTCQNDASHTKTEPIKAGHKLSGWKTDANNHWKVCEVEGCGVIVEKGAHNMKTIDGSKDKQCTVCGLQVKAPVDPTLDNQPKTGDIYAEMAMFAGVAALAVGAVIFAKRKARD